MADIVFRCEACKLSLAVEDVYAGVEFECPGCKSRIRAPEPTMEFPCPSCSCPLCTSVSYRGEPFCCPHCESELAVPSLAMVRCRQCEVYLELDDDYLAEFGGFVVECGGCGADVELPQVEFSEPEPPPPPPDWNPEEQQGDLSKTMKLDEFLDYIPQSQMLEEGRCPYCKTQLYKLHAGAYVCKRCNRVIKKVHSKKH